MATLLSRKYSIICYSYAGGSLVFNTPFALGVLTPNHVQAYVEGDVNGLGEQNYLDITYDTITGDTTVNAPIVIPPDAVGGAVTVIFTRTVPKDVLYISFAAGTDVTKTNIDGMVRYTLMALEEVLDGRWDVSFDWAELNQGYKNSLAAYTDLLTRFTGGTTGQVMTKTSGATMDFGWADIGKLTLTDNHADAATTTVTLLPANMERILLLPKNCTNVALTAAGFATNAEVILSGTLQFTVTLGSGVTWYGIDTSSTQIAVAPAPSGMCFRHMGSNQWLALGDGKFL